jgi:multidrug transporter EmrE-like cation transporter
VGSFDFRPADASDMSDKAITILVILLSVVLNAAAQLLIRVSVRDGIELAPSDAIRDLLALALQPTLVVATSCFMLSLVSWIYVLSRAETSFAYPFVSLGFVMVAAVGHFFLNEPVSPQRIAALLLIMSGMLVLAQS